MASYIHMRSEWPKFQWDAAALVALLAQVRNKQGVLSGQMEVIGFQQQNEAYLETLSEDVAKTSAIEGELLDPQQVRSSIASRLGMDIGGLPPPDRHVEAIVEVMMDATQQWEKPLSEARLFDWHAALFPTGRSGMQHIVVGRWRTDSTGPMQVVSGPMGKETVHFQAPASARLPEEMRAFLTWFNQPPEGDLVLKAAMAHLWFITLHPFDDGNGRIARAITDMMLCRSEQQTRRFYSMSGQIEKQKAGYYRILESTQKGGLDITEWLLWFLHCMSGAIDASSIVVQKIMRKHRFWAVHQAMAFNKRQIHMLELLLGDFYGNLTTSKWAIITKCSQDTALRDIQDLMEKDVLEKTESGGRSTNYQLAAPVE